MVKQKQFRKRLSSSSESDNDEDNDGNKNKNNYTSGSKITMKTKKKVNNNISFMHEDEEEEEDDSQIFQVSKTKVSKTLKKKMMQAAPLIVPEYTNLSTVSMATDTNTNTSATNTTSASTSTSASMYSQEALNQLRNSQKYSSGIVENNSEMNEESDLLTTDNTLTNTNTNTNTYATTTTGTGNSVNSSSSRYGMVLSGEEAEQMEEMTDIVNSTKHHLKHSLPYNNNNNDNNNKSNSMSFLSETFANTEQQRDLLALKTARIKNLKDLDMNKSTRLSTSLQVEEEEFIPLEVEKSKARGLYQSNTSSHNTSGVISMHITDDDNDNVGDSSSRWEAELISRAGVRINNTNTNTNTTTNSSTNASIGLGGTERLNSDGKRDQNLNMPVKVSVQQCIDKMKLYMSQLKITHSDYTRRILMIEEEAKITTEKKSKNEMKLKSLLSSDQVFQVIIVF